MLSPGEWYKQVPKTLAGNLKWRALVLAECAASEELRLAVAEICKRDILFWVNTFVWQFNPKKKGNEVGPFITWDFQDDAILGRPETSGTKGLIWCYEEERSAVIEKSREMGASWLLLILEDWACRFHSWQKWLCISRNADAVDNKDDPDSLLWKLEFLSENLPDWMTEGWVRKKMHIGFPNRSTITGQASTGKAGVGGRASGILLDEFSLVEEDEEVRRRTALTSDTRFFNGTHQGIDTEFYRLTQSPEIVKIVMHWTQHPDKNKGLYRYNIGAGKVEVLDPSFTFPPDFKYVMDGSPTGGPFPGIRSPWYDKKCKEIGSARGVSMELDIDPLGAVSEFFDRLVISDLQRNYCTKPYWEGDLDYDPISALPRSLVKREGGPLKLWMTPDGGQPRVGVYAFGIDPATGMGASPSCIAGGDARTGERILEYRNPYISPDKLGPLLVALAWLFKDESGQGALLCWETPGPGYQLGKVVMETGYRNIYWYRDEFKINPSVSDRPGWFNQPNAKDLLLSEYRAALTNRSFLNRSESALAECRMFRYDNTGKVEHSLENAENDPSGARLNHADMVIADALCCKMLKRFGLAQPQQPEQAIPPMCLEWRNRLKRGA